MKSIKFKNFNIQISEKNYKHQKNMPTYTRLEKGVYENEEISLLERVIKPTSKVLDLGASLGVSSCVINDILEDKTQMVVVEANPNLIDDIINNRDINNLGFKVEHGAVSHNNRKVKFNFNGLSLSGSIKKKEWLNNSKWGEYQSIELETITPLDIEAKYNINFNVLSCDIEGEEYNLLNGLYDYFKNYDAMVVEFHEHSAFNNINRNYIEKLYSNEFKIERINNTTLFEKK